MIKKEYHHSMSYSLHTLSAPLKNVWTRCESAWNSTTTSMRRAQQMSHLFTHSTYCQGCFQFILSSSTQSFFYCGQFTSILSPMASSLLLLLLTGFPASVFFRVRCLQLSSLTFAGTINFIPKEERSPTGLLFIGLAGVAASFTFPRRKNQHLLLLIPLYLSSTSPARTSIPALFHM